VTAVVIGGGIAGVSVAHELAAHTDVVLLEREDQLAHHTTGRSAAAYLETYGGPVVRRLTVASRASLEPFLSPRPLLWTGGPERSDALTAIAEAGRALVPSVRVIDFDEAHSLCPVLVRERHSATAVLEPDAMDIDVAALHQSYVQGLRSRGGQIHRNAPVIAIERLGTRWRVITPAEDFYVDLVVNAAGAWCDEIAALAGVRRIGLQPLRRTAFTCAATDDIDVRSWPLVADVDDGYYFKPEGPQLLCSLADESPSRPCDARPEEVDVALAIERINDATTLGLRHVRRAWAGLRTFAPDRSLVIGVDPEARGFCWLAGQGGYGIQTAPAAARAATGLVIEDRLPADVLALGVSADQLSPARLR